MHKFTLHNYTRKYSAEVAAHWISPDMKRTTTFLWRPRKYRDSDGSQYWGGSWAIVGADNEWHNIDQYHFYKCLGLKVSPSDNPTLAATLKKAGFRVHDETLAVTVVFD